MRLTPEQLIAIRMAVAGLSTDHHVAPLVDVVLRANNYPGIDADLRDLVRWDLKRRGHRQPMTRAGDAVGKLAIFKAEGLTGPWADVEESEAWQVLEECEFRRHAERAFEFVDQLGLLVAEMERQNMNAATH